MQEKPDQQQAIERRALPGTPGGNGEDEDPGRRDVEQAKDDAGREIEELARFEFVGEDEVGGVRIEGADDEKPGQREQREECCVTGDCQPFGAQTPDAQAAAGEQRQAAAAKDEGDDRPLLPMKAASGVGNCTISSWIL